MEEKQLRDFFDGLDRSVFLEGDYKDYAQYNNPLPIGHGQTISQPSLVRGMTWELMVEKHHRVLEIGTGSGYQTAFLAEFAKEVYTVERIEELSGRAQEVLARLGYTNIHFKVANGSEGWKEHAPFDRIMVTAAAGRIPDALVEQLAKGGRMIIPVGERGVQDLMLVEKNLKGELSEWVLDKVMFVELKGEYGWKQ